MSEIFRLATLNAYRSRLFGSVANIVGGTMFVVLVTAHLIAKADTQQCAVVARVDAKSAGLTPVGVTVRIGNMSVPVAGIKSSPEIPRNIAIVIDVGPDQATVLSKEKDLAIALINEFSDASTSFTIVSAGISSQLHATTADRSVAIEHIHDMAGDMGEKRSVPIYDAIGTAVRQISQSPGLRVVIFIGEGNDGGSRAHYAELRSLAESSQIAFFAALVADHSLRGTKSILRYGWNLRELTSDTVGIFLENEKMPKATRRLGDSIRGLRLVTFDMPSLRPGRYKISGSERQGKRIRAQRAVVIP